MPRGLEFTKNRSSSFRVAVARNLADGFVIQAIVFTSTFVRTDFERAPIELDLLATGKLIAELRWSTVDHDSTLLDPAFGLPA